MNDFNLQKAADEDVEGVDPNRSDFFDLEFQSSTDEFSCIHVDSGSHLFGLSPSDNVDPHLSLFPKVIPDQVRSSIPDVSDSWQIQPDTSARHEYSMSKRLTTTGENSLERTTQNSTAKAEFHPHENKRLFIKISPMTEERQLKIEKLIKSKKKLTEDQKQGLLESANTVIKIMYGQTHFKEKIELISKICQDHFSSMNNAEPSIPLIIENYLGKSGFLILLSTISGFDSFDESPKDLNGIPIKTISYLNMVKGLDNLIPLSEEASIQRDRSKKKTARSSNGYFLYQTHMKKCLSFLEATSRLSDEDLVKSAEQLIQSGFKEKKLDTIKLQNSGDFNSIAGCLWKTESCETKSKVGEFYEKYEKEIHESCYPDYKFAPVSRVVKRKSKKKVRLKDKKNKEE